MTEILPTNADPRDHGRAHGRGSGTAALSNPSASLDKDGFLKLFVTQLQHQDPSAPKDANECVTQMTPFSMVEGMTNMRRRTRASRPR